MWLLKGLRDFGLVGAVALLVGCEAASSSTDVSPGPAESSDAIGYERSMVRIPRQRVEGLERALAWPAEMEATRPGRVEGMLAHGQSYIEDQASDLANNVDGAGRLLDRDLNRANNELPRDAGVLLRMLFGFPVERAPRHAVRMFY